MDRKDTSSPGAKGPSARGFHIFSHCGPELSEKLIELPSGAGLEQLRALIVQVKSIFVAALNSLKVQAFKVQSPRLHIYDGNNSEIKSTEQLNLLGNEPSLHVTGRN